VPGVAVYLQVVMASAAERSGNAGQLERSTRGDGGQDRSRLLPVLAAERLLRAVLLVGVGLILLTHATRIGRISRGASSGSWGWTRAAMRSAG
jgi:hypothetical protein